MSLSQRLEEYVRACFTGLWIQTHEHDDALMEIGQLCSQQDWQLVNWDVDRGLQLAGSAVEADAGSPDPLAAVRSVGQASGDQVQLLVLRNFHHFLRSPEICEAVAHQIQQGKQTHTFLVILSPVVQIPTELEKLFVVLEHELPDAEQLAEIAQGLADDDEQASLPVDNSVIEAAAGLTRYEAEGAFSLSVVRHGELRPDVVWELKSQMLKKSGLLELHRGGESFGQLGGLDNLKAFCLRALQRQVDRHQNRVQPRGVLLLSPPGCGKSQFAKALGNEVGRPTLNLNIGQLLGSLVGESEQNLSRALAIADAMAPCICYCDELDKALAGSTGSGQSDSGVSCRLFGQLLTYLNDHETDVFFIGTCNDISKLPPEFARAERFDGVFFVDLPEEPTRQAIWEIYLRNFELAEQKLPDDSLWTGAEIRACCRLAALLDIPLVQAAQNIVPVAKTAAESLDGLRSWANGRCLSADQPGIYQYRQKGNKRRRRVQSDPSLN